MGVVGLANNKANSAPLELALGLNNKPKCLDFSVLPKLTEGHLVLIFLYCNLFCLVIFQQNLLHCNSGAKCQCKDVFPVFLFQDMLENKAHSRRGHVAIVLENVPGAAELLHVEVETSLDTGEDLCSTRVNCPPINIRNIQILLLQEVVNKLLNSSLHQARQGWVNRATRAAIIVPEHFHHVL